MTAQTAPVTYRNYGVSLRLDRVNALLDDRDLIAETRPAWRARMQYLATHRGELEALTVVQLGLLWDALIMLPMDSSMSYVDFVAVRDNGAANRRSPEQMRVMYAITFETSAFIRDEDPERMSLLWAMA